ncbi:MAG: M20/M25/M40 family metallo-hydrolase [Chloroflexi bacterium]|nr:M20/M25/M40 family metallo-hydrolase [Chloroflexota bacterium]MCI0825999.1 M20/M25/M40 family metallo-hydrolase [Chloroflexota bacterium]MCI0858335.1 M20/M25/M40 family metallo-hydrolase [Chloroflexota bacterium]
MANRDRLLKTLIDLIQIDSPTGEEDAMDREVSSRLEALGLKVHHDSFNNVIAKLPGAGEPVLLSAHLDTVEPGRGIQPVLDGDVLRSDGTTILGGDCKSGVSIVLESLTTVTESGDKHLPIEVVFTRAEEGGLVGVHHLDFSQLSAKRGVVFDGEGAVNRVSVAAPSQNVVTAQIRGRSAHAGVEPEKGLSAIILAAEILTQLPLGRIDQETTANIGRIEGGLKRNIIPELVLLDGELRSLDNAKLDRYSQEFQKVFDQARARHPDAEITLDIRNTYQAYRVADSHPAVAMIGRALARIGMEIRLEATGGGSDANVFQEHGIVALPVGIGVESFHTVRESAVVSQVLQGAEMCEGIIRGV